MGITAFLPCRAGSERVKNKNTRPFGACQMGLIELKLRQLRDAREIDSIVVSTDDPKIWAYASNFPNVSVYRRAPELCVNTTSTDELVSHAAELIPDGHILWTHVTSPFITAVWYDAMIRPRWYQRGYDSLMSVRRVQKFIWQNDAPLNYDRSSERWPRTQTLKPVYEITSGVFLASAETYRKRGDRIGRNPFLFEVDAVAGIDVDTKTDFAIAESLFAAGWGAQ